MIGATTGGGLDRERFPECVALEVVGTAEEEACWLWDGRVEGVACAQVEVVRAARAVPEGAGAVKICLKLVAHSLFWKIRMEFGMRVWLIGG